MKRYSLEEKLEYGRQLYEGEITPSELREKLNISQVLPYLWKKQFMKSKNIVIDPKHTPLIPEELEKMSREELIDAVLDARIEAERAKKGYIVEGGGSKKKIFKTIAKDQNLK